MSPSTWGPVRFVSDDATAEDETDFFLVLNAPVAALEEAPAYTGGMGDAMMDADTAMEETGAAVEGAMEETGAAVEGAMEETGEAMEGAMDAVETEVDGAMDAAEGEQPATVATETDAEVTTDLQDGAEPVDPAGGPLSYGAGLIEREGYATAPLEELTSENLTGAPAYDSTDDHIGEVSEIILSDSGEVELGDRRCWRLPRHWRKARCSWNCRRSTSCAPKAAVTSASISR